MPKVFRLKIGEVLYEKAYMSPRPPPQISFRHDWARGEVPLGSTVDNNQKENLFNSHKKKLPDEQNSSNQPNQSQSQSVIDQGNLITHKTCLLLKVKRPVLKRSV